MKRTATAREGWLLPYLRKNVLLFSVVFILGVFAVACAAAMMYTSGYLISRSALKPENILMVYVPIVLVRVFGFGKAVLQYTERLVSHDVVLRVIGQMRERLYDRLEPHAATGGRSFQTGTILGLLAEDIEQLQNMYLRFLLPMLTGLLLFGIGIALLGRLDTIFALQMGLYTGFMAFGAPCVVLWRTLGRQVEWKKARSRSYRKLTDALFGMTDWKLSGRVSALVQELNDRERAAAQLYRSVQRSEWRLSLLTQVLGGGAIAAFTIWSGGMATQGRIEATAIAAYALVAFPLLDALIRAGHSVTALPEYRESLIRLQDTEQAYSPLAPTKAATAESAGSEQTASWEVEDHYQLEVQDGSFKYPDSQIWAVQNIHLHIAPASKVAILGRSGSGKSTILKLMQGLLHPTSGTVLINGQPIRSPGPPAHLFSTLNQAPYLFDTTVANNIRMAKPGASDADIQRVTRMVGLHEQIQALPDGYTTLMQEAGSRFSGGEQRRLALARVLLQDHPIVILDEPAAGLDPWTEQALIATIMDVLRHKTLIWVTHHLRGMEQMDEIIFMEQGRIRVRGTHRALLESDERYRSLYRLDRPFSY
ncbi:thiol reductant ABC exporter subunit CydC [Paenibacillus sp. P96]|uniref:Thiol reductant ABC exporter subunit CydC n=1 Tax=Paenibacillus zeirhizosphaerae TaxID=2987519 RepID=A0ABT9FVV7_9BACL|nr:thiol reductant ABC exporter subunit CydC [Paenibacillus sp. P96]MDP4098830.1 thiol reductant ABC exporter subunit CydC [Paenibacillus sp. P96]